MKKILVVWLSLVLIVITSMSTFAQGYDNFDFNAESQFFVDVPSTAWYYNDVSMVAAAGIIKGVGDNYFNPNGNLTFAEVMTLTAKVRAIYSGDITTLNNYLNSPTDSHWASGVKVYCQSKGMPVPNSEHFDLPVSRATMARYFGCALPESEFIAINDIYSAPEYPKDTFVRILYKAGVFVGDNNGFRLYDRITRAEAAAIIHRVINPDKRINVLSQMKLESATTTNSQEQIAQEMLRLVNELRAKAGKNPLTIHPELMEATKILATGFSQGATPSYLLDGRLDTGLIKDLDMSLYFKALYTIGDSPYISQYFSDMNKGDNLKFSLSDKYNYYGVAYVKVENNYYWVQCFGFDSKGTTSTNTVDNSSKSTSDYTADDRNNLLSSQSIASALNILYEECVMIRDSIERGRIVLIALPLINSNLNTINTRMNTEDYNATEVITSATMMNNAVNEIKTNLYQSGYDDSNSDMILLSQTQEIIKEIISKASSSVNSNGN